MGSAVSSVSGMAGGILGGGIQGITQGVIPGANLANQQTVNTQIGNLQGQSANYNNANTVQQAAADQQRLAAQNQIGNAQGAIGNAQGLNQGGDVQSALALLQSQANGTAPSAAQGVLQQGTDQAIATQAALANSGNLSQMISGQKTAMDNAANLVQQSANQASQLRANQQQTGQQNYAAAAGNQAAQAGTNAATANALAGTAGNLYGAQQAAANNYGTLGVNAANQAGQLGLGQLGSNQETLNQAQQQQATAAGGMLNGIGGSAAALAPTAMAMMSDEDSKTNISSDRTTRSKGISDYFKSQNKPADSTPTPKSDDSSSSKSSSGDDDDPQMKARKAIKEGFMSDEDTKTDIKKGSLLHAFLDGLEPVTYKYKEPTGEMGKTPGTHMGIIAQDVEKAPGGQSMVMDTPEGKAIDMPSAMGMLMSAAADAHERMSYLEELFKSKKKVK